MVTSSLNLTPVITCGSETAMAWIPGRGGPSIAHILCLGSKTVKPRLARRVPARWVLWSVLLWLSLLLCGFGPPKLVDRELAPRQRLSVGELRAWAAAADLEDVTATAFVVYDMNNERVVFARNGDTPLAPASLTKLVTALLVFERGDLDATVTIEARDLVGDATMGLAAGEEVTVTDLLWGLLIPSGNDAAMALAHHVAGSIDAFVALMNTRAAEMGLGQSHFVNPHGLDALGHVSSAADLTAVTRALWAYPLFRAIVGTASITQAGHALVNTNEWLTTFPGATGVKTGTTDAAGECLVATVERDGRTLLLVILGSTERYRDAERLYAAYETAYSRLADDGRELSILNRVYGDAGVWYVQPAGPAPDLSAYGHGGLELNGFRRLETMVSTGLEQGAHVGLLEWRMGDIVVATQPLVVR